MYLSWEFIGHVWDTLCKMNSDNNGCSTLTSNIMTEYDYV